MPQPQLLPDIGSSGLYELALPFSTRLIPNTQYVCRAIRKLNEIIAKGIDPYQEYYAPNGLSTPDYETDLNNGVCIVALQAGSGTWVYVPSSYILKFPNTNGVRYTVTALAVSLGAIPDGYNLTPLQGLIDSTVYAALGIHPTFKAIAVSNPAMVPAEDHVRLENARTANVSITEPLAARVARLTAENATLALKLQQAEEWIRNNH